MMNKYVKEKGKILVIMKNASNLRHFMISNEIKSTVSLAGNIIKSITTGGDKIVSRNHFKGEDSFTPHFMTYIMANDLTKYFHLIML